MSVLQAEELLSAMIMAQAQGLAVMERTLNWRPIYEHPVSFNTERGEIGTARGSGMEMGMGNTCSSAKKTESVVSHNPAHGLKEVEIEVEHLNPMERVEKASEESPKRSFSRDMSKRKYSVKDLLGPKASKPVRHSTSPKEAEVFGFKPTRQSVSKPRGKGNTSSRRRQTAPPAPTTAPGTFVEVNPLVHHMGALQPVPHAIISDAMAGRVGNRQRAEIRRAKDVVETLSHKVPREIAIKVASYDVPLTERQIHHHTKGRGKKMKGGAFTKEEAPAIYRRLVNEVGEARERGAMDNMRHAQENLIDFLHEAWEQHRWRPRDVAPPSSPESTSSATSRAGTPPPTRPARPNLHTGRGKDVKMSKKAYMAEHKELIGMLNDISSKAKKEAVKQTKEVKSRGKGKKCVNNIKGGCGMCGGTDGEIVLRGKKEK